MVAPLVNDSFVSLTPYVPGKPVAETERELGITGAIKLASNENPLGPSPRALEAIRKTLPALADYPDGGAFYLKRRLCEHHGITADRLVIGNGSNEIIEMLIRTCMRPGENVVHMDPSFIVYKLCVQAAGHEVRVVPHRDWGYDLAAMAKAMDERTKLVFIGNPNNPTGTYVNKAELDAFVRAIPASTIVVMDEAYFEYAHASDYPNGFDLLAKRERAIVLRTFSKAYGLAGVRVGYGVGSPELIDYLNRGRQTFNCNTLGQVAAVAALDDQEHVQKAVAQNRSEMARVVPRLRALGVTARDSQANFVFVDLGRDAGPIYLAMLKLGVIIRPMAPYGLPTCVRITMGTPPQNDRLLAALERVLGG